MLHVLVYAIVSPILSVGHGLSDERENYDWARKTLKFKTDTFY